MIRIRKRFLWFARTTRFVSFNAIKAVTYSYGDLDPSQHWAWTYQTNDLFSVGLWLHSNEQVPLFRFYGAGDFQNDGPFPDWFYWDDIINAKLSSGNQEGDSRAYAEILAAMIGVDIDNPLP